MTFKLVQTYNVQACYLRTHAMILESLDEKTTGAPCSRATVGDRRGDLPWDQG